jgi:hypothetical protein
MKPITGIFGCCARTTSGQTGVVEPTFTLMNSRRLMVGLVPPKNSTRNAVAYVTVGSFAGACSAPTNVRFRSLTDICTAIGHVRFAPNSDRKSGHQRKRRCLKPITKHNHQACAVGSVGNAPERGNVILISVNSPGVVSTSIDPPCCLTMMSWLMDRPSPVPSPAGLVV